MEPNDEHLCIILANRGNDMPHPIFLPFEGDGMFSIILSKALLPAHDTDITNPTITQQIKR